MARSVAAREAGEDGVDIGGRRAVALGGERGDEGDHVGAIGARVAGIVGHAVAIGGGDRPVERRAHRQRQSRLAIERFEIRALAVPQAATHRLQRLLGERCEGALDERKSAFAQRPQDQGRRKPAAAGQRIDKLARAGVVRLLGAPVV